MPSTKSLYVKWLVVYILALLCGIFLIALNYKTPYIGVIVVIIALPFALYYAARIFTVRSLEKKCVACEGRFVTAEQTSLGWRNPKFSLTLEIEVNGKKILVKTAGVYSSYHVSGLTKDTTVKVGYLENAQEVITL